MKEIVIKKNGHTIYKRVPDDYKEEKATVISDMTTSNSKSIGFTDIEKSEWDRIFHNDEK